jgi:NAD(P)-dependent dehydrogenase (short-subunit alcohol dehydrogenase family)
MTKEDDVTTQSIPGAPAPGRPLQGQHAIVTGASRGIGAGIASSLGRLGADVTLMSLPEPQLAEHTAFVQKAHGVRAQGILLDLVDEARVAAAFAEATAAFGPAQILVNNAGIALAAPFHKTDRKFWQRMIDIDLTGQYLCTQQVAGAMVKAGYGRIVNVVSTAGHTGYADTDVVAATLDNIVAKTGRTREQALAELVAHNPQGRLIKPEEVGEAVGFLCLPSSASVTGQSLMVDGGEIL